MKRIKGALWAKILGLALVAVSTLGVAYGIAGMALFAGLGEAGESRGVLREYLQQNMAENYAAMLLDNAFDYVDEQGRVLDYNEFGGLEGGSLVYSVAEIRMVPDAAGRMFLEETTVYGDAEYDRSKDDSYYFMAERIGSAAEGYAQCSIQYNCNDPLTLAFCEPRQNRHFLWGGMHTEASGEFESEEDELSQSQVNATAYAVYMKLGPGYTPGKTQKFAIGVQDYMGLTDEWVDILMSSRELYVPLFVISILVLAGAAVFLCSAAGHRPGQDEVVLRAIDRLPYGIYFALVCVGLMAAVMGCVACVQGVSWHMFGYRDSLLLLILLIVGASLLAAVFGMSTAVRIKTGKFWRYTLCYYPLHGLRRLGRWCGEEMGRKGSLLKIGIFCSAGISFLQMLVILATESEVDECMLFILYKCVELPLLAVVLYQMEKLRQGGKRVAAGDYSQPIDTKKMLPVLKEHGENINNVSNGIAVAVKEQMKSEHLKTELITNVTHDIKTPLTSIISYVDLMKKEEITNPVLLEYVEVLDRQSARLKKLIEDLLEASKASTGNIKVKMETCDARVMVTQVVGEYQEKMEKKGLDIIVSSPQKPVYIMADGRHLWRVLDNVMSNIEKYAMEHTRVYITMECLPDGARLVFKNVSRDALNISSDELMERFVRGDSSRNTNIEGHGLGLSIAQSLTKLMKGSLEVSIDGDLFKVSIVLSKR